MHEVLTSPGFTVFWVIEASVAFLILVTIFGKPRNHRATAIVLGSLAIVLGLVLVFTLILALFTSALVP